MELSKKDKKTARIIIDKGIEKEKTLALTQAEDILKKWRSGALDVDQSYAKLYRHLEDYDKRIARLYDGITGSRYLDIIAIQRRDGFAGEEDLEPFSEEAKEYLQRWLSVWGE